MEKTYPTKQEIRKDEELLNEEVKLSEDPAENEQRDAAKGESSKKLPSQFSEKRNKTMPDIDMEKVPAPHTARMNSEGSDTLRLKLKCKLSLIRMLRCATDLKTTAYSLQCDDSILSEPEDQTSENFRVLGVQKSRP